MLITKPGPNVLQISWPYNHPVLFIKMTKILFPVVLLHILLSPVLNSGVEKEIHSHFTKLTHLFNGCHFLFRVLIGNLESFQFESDILTAMNTNTTLSIHTGSYVFQPKDRHNSISKDTCLIHIYLYSEIEIIQSVRLMYLDIATYFQHLFEVRPNHAIFLGKQRPNPTQIEMNSRLKFYNYDIPTVSIRGVILFIDYVEGDVNLICVPCYIDSTPRFERINLSQISDRHNFHNLSSTLNSHLRGGIGISGVLSRLVTPESSCTLRGKMQLYQAADHVEPSYDFCVLHALKNKLNYTIKSFGELQRRADLAVFHEKPFTTNLDIFQVKRSFIQNPFLLSFDPLVLAAYQQRPKLTAKVLIKPYDSKIWLLLIASAVALSVLTVGAETIQNVRIKLSPIGLDILSSVLDQPMSRNVQRVVANNGRSLLPVWLRLWMLMAICICNAYKGKVYSYIANGIPPEWPANLEEYAVDNKFLKLTMSMLISKDAPGKSTSMVGYHISEAINYTKDTTILRRLQEGLRFSSIGITRPFLLRMLNEIAENGRISTDQESHPKGLVMIDFGHLSLLHLKILIDSLYSESLVSTKLNIILPICLPGMWSLQRNYFHDHLSIGLGQLDQAGFSEFFWNHLNDLGICRKLDVGLRHNVKVPPVLVLQKCRYMINTGMVLDTFKSHPKPLNWNQLKSIFFVFLQLVSVPSIAFLFEFVYQYFGIRLIYNTNLGIGGLMSCLRLIFVNIFFWWKAACLIATLTVMRGIAVIKWKVLFSRKYFLKDLF